MPFGLIFTYLQISFLETNNQKKNSKISLKPIYCFALEYLYFHIVQGFRSNI